MFNRFNGNVVPFASDATGTNRTIFGDITQSDNIDDNLNADFKTGWEIVGVNDNPTKQDFNALAYTISNLVAYLYQQGVAEWNTDQEYLTNSYCVGSDGKLYRAKTGTTGLPNQGNDPTTDSTNWEWTLKDLNDVIFTGPSTDNAIARFNGTSGKVQNSSVYIDDNGGLGIGTLPVSLRKLHVKGTIENLVRLENSSASNGNYCGIEFTGGDINSQIRAYQTSANYSDLRFAIKQNTSVLEKMILDQNGFLKFDSGYGSAQTVFGVRAWVNFQGQGTVTIRNSGGVSSITDNGSGDYSINLTNTLPDKDCAVLITAKQNDDANATLTVGNYYYSGSTTSSIRIKISNSAQSSTDSTIISVAIIR